MAKFQVTFESKGRKSVLVLEDLNRSEAAKQAEFFQLSHGRIAKVEAVKA